MSAEQKAYERFRARIKSSQIRIGEMFFMSGVTGWTVPSGVLIYDTTNNKLLVGTGSSAETVTSS